jgi:RNA polymerase sigma factor, sigma-70 family
VKSRVFENKRRKIMNYTKYIYVKGKRVYMSDEVFQAYKQQKNREEYLRRLDFQFIDYNFSDNHNLADIEDESMNVEKIVETQILIQQLRKAIRSLTDEEREIIKMIYFEEQSLRRVASERNISHPALMKKRDKILKKLREIIGE